MASRELPRREPTRRRDLSGYETTDSKQPEGERRAAGSARRIDDSDGDGLVDTATGDDLT